MNKKITFVLVLALTAFLVMGVASAGFLDFLGGGDDTVKIGYLPSDHDAALFVADQQGLFEEKNISVELVQFNNGGDLMTAMASGDVDVGYVGISPVLSSISAGVPAKVISAAQIEGSGIVVTDDSLHYAVYTFMRVLGCFPCLGFLALTTPIAKILHCLSTLKVPKIMIEIGLLMYNAIFIFLNEIDTMQKAQDTRLGYHSYWSSFKSLGALTSTIFLRSLDKSETLQFALDSRGYTGELPLYEPKEK